MTRPTRITIGVLLLVLLGAGGYVLTRKLIHMFSGEAVTANSDTSAIGIEMEVTTDANLRIAPSFDSGIAGLAEKGSRVRVTGVENDWRQVNILEHGREKEDPGSADSGWIHKKLLRDY